MSPHYSTFVKVAASIKSKVAATMGTIGGLDTEIMLDSGSSVSLVRKDIVYKAHGIDSISPDHPPITASGDQLPFVEYIRAPVSLGEFQLVHKFVVVENLMSPVILGVDSCRIKHHKKLRKDCV